MAGWILYGSTFIYSEDIQKCDKTSTDLVFEITMSKIEELRITALVLIFLGYAFTLCLVVMACIGCCGYFVYKSWT